MQLIYDIIFPHVGSAWPWYVGGPLIGLIVPVLLIFGNKHFGVSSSLQHLCRVILPRKFSAGLPYFDYDIRRDAWNLFFVLGMLLGGWIGLVAFDAPEAVTVADRTANALAGYGITGAGGLAPVEIFSWSGLFSVPGFVLIVVGGFLVGFGTRYGNGCTSGHAIMGLALLSPTSLIATICFFAGGVFATFVLFPLIFP